MSAIAAGRVALITGGGSGIGRATALEFAKEGASVVIGDESEDGGRRTVEMIRNDGGEAAFVQVDVASTSAVRDLVSSTIDRYGHLDFAHNNAGITGSGIGGSRRSLIAEFPEERWERVIAVNLTGVWLCMKYEIAQMLRQGGGSIVNTSSVLGLVGYVGGCAYVASKHGVAGLTKTAALEYAQNGIRVNCVCPGWIETPMISGILSDQERRSQVLATEPVGRFGQAEEVAQAVLWLCSDAASFVTGHTMTVDGGYTAR